MTRFVFLLLVAVVPCWGLTLLTISKPTISSEAADTLRRTFNSPECENPCWLGIEVGVTNRETVITIFEEHGIEYETPGVMHLHFIPTGLVPGIKPEGIPSVHRHVSVYGDINVGQRNSDIVQSIGFVLDVCVTTILATYGAPGVWRNAVLIYPEHQLFFTVDAATQHINGVYLHQAYVIPSTEELENLARYADTFSADCSDVFTEYPS